MSYRREIELVFDAAVFQQPSSPTALCTSTSSSSSTSTIDLWYIAATRAREPLPQTTEREFYLQGLRDHLRSHVLPVAHTVRPSAVLRLVRDAWDQARDVAGQVRLLQATAPTQVVRTGDASLEVRCELLLVPMRTKVEVAIALHRVGSVGSSVDGVGKVQVEMEARAAVVYGERFTAEGLTDFVAGRLKGAVGGEMKERQWSDVVLDLRKKLLKGRK